MRRFFIWYDNLREPWRMIVMLVLVSIGIGIVSFGNNLILSLIGCGYLIAMMLARSWCRKHPGR